LTPAAKRRKNAAHSASCGLGVEVEQAPEGERDGQRFPPRNAQAASFINQKGLTHPMRTIALLTISNIFMTFAWYGHLKYREVPLYKVIVVSWMIAFFEYCFQVPANRIGSYEFTAAQLKTIQEVITLTVFAAFSVLYLKQPLRWNYVAGFALIVAAVAVIFKKW
jgi:uncharacterized protein (DUF486 family)